MSARSRLDAARLVPEAPLPPYAYVPGRYPHPTRDPAGHSYGHAPPEPEPLEPARWERSREYLLGCDLFNHGYYWEAHETWEGLWKACGRRGTTADFLKGLIKLAAAGVKAREGRSEGVARHARRAAELLRATRQSAGSAYAGFDLDQLIAQADAVWRGEEGAVRAASGTASVAVVFGFALRPRA